MKTLIMLVSLACITNGQILQDSIQDGTTTDSGNICIRELKRKFSESEIVVEGRITKVENLYRKGGAFKRLLTLNVSSVFKGNTSNLIEVFSSYGYLDVAHRSFVLDESKIYLEEGDFGFFFLSTKIINEQCKNKTDMYKNFLKGKYNFYTQSESESAYILNDDGMIDTTYLHLVAPECNLTFSSELRNYLSSLLSLER